MRVGILGYGNLGRALVKGIWNTDHTLVAVFSRRKICEEKINIIPRSELEEHKGKIDVMLISTSSHSDVEEDSKSILPYFNTIDSYDNHKKIPTHLSSLNSIAKKNSRVAITAAGWDPGLLSVARVMAKISTGAENVNTFWGAGKSLGHTAIIKSIPGVKYAAQYTIPKDQSIKLSKNTDATLADTDRHYRECFIVPEPSADRGKIESQIRSTDSYFKGYDTSITFITEDEFLLKHNKDFHRGEIIATKIKDENKTSFDLKVDIPSNSVFTANIMISYINAIDYLQNHAIFGAYTPLDIPLSYLISKNEYNDII